MRHVLVADHDMAMFKSVEQALQEAYSVVSLPMSTEMREFLIQNPVDLILLTVSQTNMDSLIAFEKIKEIPEMKGKPVVFMTEQSGTGVEQRALSMGADDFITRPFTPQMLLHRINTCLELHDLRNNQPYVEKYQDAISISFAELVESRDETTGGHLKNTTQYFNILLEAAIANDYYKNIVVVEDVKDLLRSATLHDIGKIGINDDVLRKASPLDYKEYEYMKTHTTLGKQTFEKIIQETGGTRWLYLAKDIAYCHHEHWDGTGYPNGIKGEAIPIYARMLTIADVYDALTSRRSYKKAYSHLEAMEIIIDGKGSLFDPKLVELFVSANDRFEEILLRKKSNTETIEKE
ncbi:MAG: rpfG3 [Herbinix sp.]|nr:rpfG3 [Herbinix sp.]